MSPVVIVATLLPSGGHFQSLRFDPRHIAILVLL